MFMYIMYVGLNFIKINNELCYLIFDIYRDCILYRYNLCIEYFLASVLVMPTLLMMKCMTNDLFKQNMSETV